MIAAQNYDIFGTLTETYSYDALGNRIAKTTDGGGSVRFLTDSTGAVTDSLVFDSFGNSTSRTGQTGDSYGFQGEQQDATGLYYLRARYMNPTTGSFTQMNTYGGSLSDPMSLHKYLFANANPVRYRDPSGNSATLEETAATIMIISVIDGAISGTIGAVINSLENITHGGKFGSADYVNAACEGFWSGFLVGFTLGFLGQVLNVLFSRSY